mmetsp:Transcript_62258/g.148585  ORF Transcript_62258/g.148585 Transcript_62258/m.148585 type:complete len:411 (+) Transcript_62258:101-1333(+)
MSINSLEIDTCCFLVHGTKFEVPQQYKVLELIGQGAYGVVCAARDESLQDDVAIKKIENVFEHITFTKRTLREMRILRHLQHENVCNVYNIFTPGTKYDFQDIYVVSGLMETNLALILKTSQEVSEEHCKFFLYQIFRGMKYVHSAQVIHRDLKPRNLLVNGNCDLRICDFGLARVKFKDESFLLSPMTEYVCTRWYRAPEVLCGWMYYTEAIDVWSIGCIFAEMLTRKALFPGNNTGHQVDLIIGLLGSPTQEELRRVGNEKCRKFIADLPYSRGCNFYDAFGGADPLGIDLLYKTLKFDPDRRISVEVALHHTFLEDLACPEDEPIRAPLDTSEFEFERRNMTMAALREELFLEAMSYYPMKLERYIAQQEAAGNVYDVRRCRLLESGEVQHSEDEGEEGEFQEDEQY